MKRTSLTRKTPMPRMKSTTKAKRATLWCDSFGVPFGDVRKWLWGRTADWSTAYPIKEPAKNRDVCQMMHILHGWPGSVCWLCNAAPVAEAHHFVSRWDFPGNICMVCRECHERVQHAPAELPGVLRAMQKHNQFLSWVHLVRARGSHLPFDTLD